MEKKYFDPELSKFLNSVGSLFTKKITFPRTIHSIKYGNYDLDTDTVTLIFEENTAKLIFSFSLDYDVNNTKQRLIKQFFLHKKNFKELKGDITGKTEDGRGLYLSDPYISNYKYTNDGVEVTVKSEKWHLFSSKANYWVAELYKGTIFSGGNLNLAYLGNYYNSNNYYLKGVAYEYFLITHKERVILVLKPDKENIDFDLLSKDLIAMGFCLGIPLGIDHLVGMNIAGEITGFNSAQYGLKYLKPRRKIPAIPYKVNLYVFPDFFEKISRMIFDIDRIDKKINFLYESLIYYLEFLSELWLNSAEIKVLLSSINASYCLIIDELDYSGKNLDFSQKIIRDLDTDLILSPVDIINKAVEISGIADIKRIKDEVLKSAITVFAPVVDNVPISFARQKEIASLTCALISKYISYKGPINYQDHLLAEDVFWKFDEVPEVRYYAETDNLLQLNDVADIWPNFEIPKIPDNPLISIIQAFANSLFEKTSGRVRARLVSVPNQKESEVKYYDFKIELDKYSFASNILFTVKYEIVSNKKHNISIVNWGGNAKKISNSKQLMDFLLAIATSDKTKDIIERLLLSIPNE